MLQPPNVANLVFSYPYSRLLETSLIRPRTRAFSQRLVSSLAIIFASREARSLCSRSCHSTRPKSSSTSTKVMQLETENNRLQAQCSALKQRNSRLTAIEDEVDSLR